MEGVLGNSSRLGQVGVSRGEGVLGGRGNGNGTGGRSRCGRIA